MDKTQSAAEGPAQTTTPPAQTSVLGWFGQLLAFAICVGFPAIVSLFAPVSWVTLERNGESVSARAKVCVLFVIPIRNLAVTNVTSVETRTYQAPASSKGTSRSTTQPDPEGFLVIHGYGEQKIEVPASTASVESVRDNARAFLEDSQATKLKLFVVAHWTIGVVTVGFLSLLTLVYVLDRAVVLIRVVQRMCGVEEHNLLLADRPQPTVEPTTHPT